MPCSAAYGLHPGGPRLPDQRRRGEVAGADAAVVDGQLGGLDVVEERQQRPGQRPDRAGDQHRLVAGGAVLADPAYGGRREPGQDVVGEVLVGDRVEVGEPGAVVLAVDRAQEVAALAALGLDQARHLGRDPAQLGEPLGAVELAQPHPQVGLDHVGRQQRAVHVEERRDARLARPSRPSARRPRPASCARAADLVEAADRRGDRRAVHVLEVVPASRRPRCRRRTSPGPPPRASR